MPTPVQDALYRRDEARWRTRRLSWLAAGGAATASVALGVVFSQLLPGHSAAAGTTGSGSAQQPGSSGGPAGGSARGSGAPSSKPPGTPATGSQQPARSQPAQAPPPAPGPAPPQVVSGGS
jgi:hypothetical protein